MDDLRTFDTDTDDRAAERSAEAARRAFADAVAKGLSQPQKTLECKYLYDARGSALFDEICTLDAYYPTRTEIGILDACVAEVAAAAGPGAELVELGSGASVKSRILLSALDRPSRYLPVDISAAHMEAAAERLRSAYPGLEIVPVAADFSQPFKVPSRAGEGQRVLFFPGSTIGNFTPQEAEDLMARLRRDMDADLFVIGVDLVKDVAVLEAAYDDPEGVTAAFDMNLLARINRELGADFDTSGFHHEARWNTDAHRIEMHLVSDADQQVTVDGTRYRFADGETIHTENSHKFTVEGFQALARRAGWSPRQVWTDPKHWFSVHLLGAA